MLQCAIKNALETNDKISPSKKDQQKTIASAIDVKSN